MNHITDLVLANLRQYDTPTICNAIELFEVRPKTEGYIPRHIAALFPDLPPAVGFASTATFRSSKPSPSDQASPGMEEQIRRFIDLEGPPFVVIHDLDDPPQSAVFGEIMCSEFQAFGAVGLVTNGAGRDIVQIEALRFPTFSSGLVCARGYSRFLALHVPVQISGLQLHPGDLIHADGNGLTVIPADISAVVADVAGEYAQAGALILDAIRARPATLDSVEEARRARAEVCDRLRRQVSRKLS